MDAKQLQLRWTDIEIRKYRLQEQQQRLSESEPEDDKKPIEDKNSNEDEETKASSERTRAPINLDEHFEDYI